MALTRRRSFRRGLVDVEGKRAFALTGGIPERYVVVLGRLKVMASIGTSLPADLLQYPEDLGSCMATPRSIVPEADCAGLASPDDVVAYLASKLGTEGRWGRRRWRALSPKRDTRRAVRFGQTFAP